MKTDYIKLEDLSAYKLSRELSEAAWKLYSHMDVQDKRIMGDQFIRAADSVGANIAEGYRRYHYLDKIKFYYIARGSLAEACHHWLGLLIDRHRISTEEAKLLFQLEIELSIKLANMIKSTQTSKNTSS